MPAERMAMCSPSRRVQAMTSAATMNCRDGNASCAKRPQRRDHADEPVENVQMVSTQPELPVRCWMIQAAAISVPSAAAIAASAITNGRTIGPCLQSNVVRS